MKKTKKKVAKKKPAAKAKAPAVGGAELVRVLQSIARSLADIKESMAYLEDIAREVEGIGADTETIIKAQYMSEEGQTVKNP
jgi:hypothetical protein